MLTWLCGLHGPAGFTRFTAGAGTDVPPVSRVHQRMLCIGWLASGSISMERMQEGQERAEICSDEVVILVIVCGSKFADVGGKPQQCILVGRTSTGELTEKEPSQRERFTSAGRSVLTRPRFPLMSHSIARLRLVLSV